MPLTYVLDVSQDSGVPSSRFPLQELNSHHSWGFNHLLFHLPPWVDCVAFDSRDYSPWTHFFITVPGIVPFRHTRLYHCWGKWLNLSPQGAELQALFHSVWSDWSTCCSLETRQIFIRKIEQQDSQGDFVRGGLGALLGCANTGMWPREKDGPEFWISWY